MKKSLFALVSVLVLVGFLPVLALSGDFSMREHIFKPTKTDKIQNVFCRFDRLTDILTPGRVQKVLMSDSSDFKVTIIREKKMTHIVIKPLKKDVTSDVFIFGRNSVLYLSVKTVYEKQHYLKSENAGGGYGMGGGMMGGGLGGGMMGGNGDGALSQKNKEKIDAYTHCLHLFSDQPGEKAEKAVCKKQFQFIEDQTKFYMGEISAEQLSKIMYENVKHK